MSLSPVTNSSSLSSSASTSRAIRQEIQRFESVHPSIYAIYDLIELVGDPLLAQQIREHVVCIEDSFVNSQEWTLGRFVPDLRLGIVGSLSSGKSALVHRYLTGSYMQEESPEGGRFKKEIIIDNQSQLLLIRDEGGAPEAQFSSWVDGVVFVFSVDNENSFQAVSSYYLKMVQCRPHLTDLPLILVGTQDGVSEKRPRVIEEAQARKLASDLSFLAYYETCATYGLNVDRVFQDVCEKITRRKGRPAMVNGNNGVGARRGPLSSFAAASSPQRCDDPFFPNSSSPATIKHTSPSANYNSSSSGGSSAAQNNNSSIINQNQLRRSGSGSSFETNHSVFAVPYAVTPASKASEDPINTNINNTSSYSVDLPTPTSTPNSSRKHNNRRRSNLFTPSKKNNQQSTDAEHPRAVSVANLANGLQQQHLPQLGSGRSIPLRQGYLLKKSSKGFSSKEWKKKYVALCQDGRLTYHPSLHEYMENIHGKEISLQCVTVKVPGQKPRGSRTVASNNSIATTNGSNNNGNGGGVVSSSDSLNFGRVVEGSKKGEKVLLTGYEMLKEPNEENNEGGESKAHNSSTVDTPNVKKRNRKQKSKSLKGGIDNDDSELYEFHIVSLDNKQWCFEASSSEEREEWVEAIEQQILSSLQGNMISKFKRNGVHVPQLDKSVIQNLRTAIEGNDRCVDCDAPDPTWASINLGALMCIECSGVHRQLGSHVSRVRSLDLDEWPPSHLAVMAAMGNIVANSIWEGNKRLTNKPTANASQEEKETFIVNKYSKKLFLADLQPSKECGNSVSGNLINAVWRSDVTQVAHCLCHATSKDVNERVSSQDRRTPLHLATSTANLAITQMLIWSNADVRALDESGRSALSIARRVGSDDIISLLISNGCPDEKSSALNDKTNNPHNSNNSTRFMPPRSSTVSWGPGGMEKLASSIL